MRNTNRGIVIPANLRDSEEVKKMTQVRNQDMNLLKKQIAFIPQTSSMIETVVKKMQFKCDKRQTDLDEIALCSFEFYQSL